MVSTHSRLKAAGQRHPKPRRSYHGFNTQPPEGGWICILAAVRLLDGFNTQPPEGGWEAIKRAYIGDDGVSTHSRLKAAGSISMVLFCPPKCFNTQPPEGGWR